MCDWGCRTAIDELHKDGVRMGKGWKVGLEENRGVEEGTRGRNFAEAVFCRGRNFCGSDFVIVL